MFINIEPKAVNGLPKQNWSVMRWEWKFINTKETKFSLRQAEKNNINEVRTSLHNQFSMPNFNPQYTNWF